MPHTFAPCSIPCGCVPGPHAITQQGFRKKSASECTTYMNMHGELSYVWFLRRKDLSIAQVQKGTPRCVSVVRRVIRSSSVQRRAGDAHQQVRIGLLWALLRRQPDVGAEPTNRCERTDEHTPGKRAAAAGAPSAMHMPSPLVLC